MTYLIDAWLDRPHPYLRILHRETGEVCAVLEEEALDELRDLGDLDMSGLNSSEPGCSRSWCGICFCSAMRGRCAPGEQTGTDRPGEGFALDRDARPLLQGNAYTCRYRLDPHPARAI